MNIYLASPFFNGQEIFHVENAETMLRKLGHVVFSPRENQLKELDFGSIPWRTAVFNNDIKHIQWADVVFAIVPASVGDSGTAMEIGYAYGIGKPILVFHPGDESLNLMVADSLHAHFKNWSEVLNYDFKRLPIIPYKGEVI